MKNLMNLGKILNKKEQKAINGGTVCRTTNYKKCSSPGMIWTPNQVGNYNGLGTCCIYRL